MGFHERNALVLAAWVPITALLFRLLGPRRAALVAVVGGHVFLPGMAPFVEFFPPSILPAAAKVSWLYFEKHASIGMGLILGIACCDRRALLSARPSWLDLPILAYVLYPLTGVANESPAALLDSIGAALIRGLCWLPPYIAARLYFGDDEGVGRVAVAIVVASLINVPICLWETTMGPRWYVAGFLYRWDFVGGMVSRLGGWRPEGMMGYGIDLTNWMALAALLSFWLWLGRAWRPKWGPAWWPSLLLIGTAFAIRGLYGDIYLVVGLAVALLTWTFRTRWFILALAALVPLYLNLRYFGVLTRNQAETHELLQRIGKTASLGTRFWSEDGALAVIYPDRFLFGTGVDFWHYKYVKPLLLGPGSDGWWVTLVYAGGFLGLALHYLAVHLTPAGLALAYPPRRPTRLNAVSPAWGLAPWSLLHMIDSLQNSIRMTPTLLIAGALVGQAVTRRRKTRSSSSSSSSAVEAPTPTALVPAVAALACLLYVFGHGPVEGYELVKLVGGLGAALLFAAAGGLGAWAAARFPIGRVAVYGLLFATLGVLVQPVHPPGVPAGRDGRHLAGAGALRGRRRLLAVRGRRPRLGRFRAGGRADGCPLPGATARRRFPWLAIPAGRGRRRARALPALPVADVRRAGARASRARWPVHLTAGALFALAAGIFWLDGLGSGRGEPVKFPMNLTYALLSCAAVGLAFALAEGLNRVERASAGALAGGSVAGLLLRAFRRGRLPSMVGREAGVGGLDAPGGGIAGGNLAGLRGACAACALVQAARTLGGPPCGDARRRRAAGPGRAVGVGDRRPGRAHPRCAVRGAGDLRGQHPLAGGLPVPLPPPRGAETRAAAAPPVPGSGAGIGTGTGAEGRGRPGPEPAEAPGRAGLAGVARGDRGGRGADTTGTWPVPP